MNKKIYSFEYKHSANLGNEIQTIAATRLIRELGFEFGGVVDRDAINTDEPINLLCNGFFDINCLHNLFKDNINPIFSNIHIARKDNNLKAELIEQFKKHEPIGCRDRDTMQFLQSKGIKCFFNYCLTLTLPRREKDPENGKIFIVDLNEMTMRAKHRSQREVGYFMHLFSNRYLHASKMLLAQELLDLYKNKASLIITSRLHCALPCIAMGIPVIYFADKKEIPRQELVKEFIPINSYKTRYCLQKVHRLAAYYEQRKFFKLAKNLCLSFWQLKSFRQNESKVDWNPPSLDIKATKQQIINNTAKLIQDKIR
ncbi:MAG: polysaccharide pyruvyl transferase family protein [Candidatus Oxydemutatoraceae bacterium WSBS_2016_MAG_OTU14]